jgi:hypothetical protein
MIERFGFFIFGVVMLVNLIQHHFPHSSTHAARAAIAAHALLSKGAL